MSAVAERVETQLAAFRRGALDLVEEGELKRLLERSLERGRPLRVKFGMDPSSPDLHLGHAVQLRKLRDVQELGHTVVLIVGDATAMVGDPSGRNKLRPQLSRTEVEENLRTYKEQAGLVLDLGRAEVRHNSEWFDEMRFEDVLRLCGRMTVARMLERDTFQKRVAANEPVGIHEFLYPLMQGWDSVQIDCDVEIGGTDQLFNLHVGRILQQQESQRPQVLLTHPLIDGTDGRKMSKSYGNAIGLTEDAPSMFAKVMSVPDEPMRTWFTHLTRLDEPEIERVLGGHPIEAKSRLALEITTFFHGDAVARDAKERFDREVRGGERPQDIPEVAWPGAPDEELPLFLLLAKLGLASSSSDARRLVAQGGVRTDGDVRTDANERIAPRGPALVLQVGKRRFARVVRDGRTA